MSVVEDAGLEARVVAGLRTPTPLWPSVDAIRGRDGAVILPKLYAYGLDDANEKINSILHEPEHGRFAGRFAEFVEVTS